MTREKTTDKNLLALRDYIVQVRHSLGLSQADVAKLGGFPTSTLAMLEANPRFAPQHRTLKALAKGLRVPTQHLERILHGLPPQSNSDLATAVDVWTADDPQLRADIMTAATLPPDAQPMLRAGLSVLLAAIAAVPKSHD